MKTVYILKGLPASGKSTWAKNKVDEHPNSYKRVNKDDLRAMLDNDHWSRDMEKFTLKVRDQIIISALEEGKHVIVDDTNLAPKHYERIKILVHGKANVEVVDFTNISLEECIKRDLKRPKSVGESVIRQMHDQYLRKIEEYVEDITLPKCIIFDIDGTLAKMHDRGPFDWDKVQQDKPNTPIVQLNQHLAQRKDLTIIVFTGRDGVCKEQTRQWLWDNNIKFHALFTRPEGNNEKDSVIKRRLFQEKIRGKFYCEMVIDDRDQVVKMWRDMGLTCLQVAEGNF